MSKKISVVGILSISLLFVAVEAWAKKKVEPKIPCEAEITGETLGGIQLKGTPKLDIKDMKGKWIKFPFSDFAEIEMFLPEGWEREEHWADEKEIKENRSYSFLDRKRCIELGYLGPEGLPEQNCSRINIDPYDSRIEQGAKSSGLSKGFERSFLFSEKIKIKQKIMGLGVEKEPGSHACIMHVVGSLERRIRVAVINLQGFDFKGRPSNKRINAEIAAVLNALKITFKK